MTQTRNSAVEESVRGCGSPISIAIKFHESGGLTVENTDIHSIYDVAVIGGGVIGCAVACELSKTKARVILIERDNDVAMGATRANSGIVHAGYDPLPGTKMARYNVEGNAMMAELAKNLHVDYVVNGSLVLALEPEDDVTLRQLKERGDANGVPGLALLSGEEVRRREPNLSPNVRGALYAPTAGIITPWSLTIGLADTARANGCDFLFNAPVTAIRRGEDGFRLTAGDALVKARFIVNAAGGHADEVNNLAASPAFRILPGRGEYYLLDKSQGGLIHSTIFQCPSQAGKGVLVAPTTHGNLIVGPNAEAAASPDDVAVTADGLAFVERQARRSVPGFNLRESIRNYAGVRAVSTADDFIVEEAPDCPGFINAAGIKSPGLSSAPALAVDCVRLLERAGLVLQPRKDFRWCPLPDSFSGADEETRTEMVKQNPLYGRVICRCETITEGDIVAAIRRPIPAQTMDGVKRRCGAGLGRCQGGFCGPRVAAILAREWGVSLPEIRQDRPGSYLLTGYLTDGKGGEKE